MEVQLMEEKTRMLKGELADWEFSVEMKQNVLKSMRKKKKTIHFIKIILPTMISAALIILFFSGLYKYVIVPYTGSNSSPIIKEPLKNDSEGSRKKVDNEQVGSVKETEGNFVKDPNNNNMTSPGFTGLPNYTGVMIQFNRKFQSLFEPDLYDSNFKYKEMKTKQDFYQQFSELATISAIKQYSDPFLKETQDGLYIVSKPVGSIYDEDLPYNVSKINQQKYELEQYIKKGKSSLTRTITFEKINGKLLITGIEQP